MEKKLFDKIMQVIDAYEGLSEKFLHNCVMLEKEMEKLNKGEKEKLAKEIYNNTNATPEQKNTAIQEMAKINETRNSIMIAENLIKAKGLQDIVIFANSNSVSVIVKAEKLEPEQIAQIQNIV